MVYVITALATMSLAAALYFAVVGDRMRLWPDAVIAGAFLGVIVCAMLVKLAARRKDNRYSR
jgi:ABC-type Fe3+-siderophore transport system permease subunit